MSKGNGRQPPKPSADQLAEQDLIGCYLHKPSLLQELAHIVTREDLLTEPARIAYAATERVLQLDRPFHNAQAIYRQVLEDGCEPRCPHQWLQDAANRIADPTNAAYHAVLVRQAADNRRLQVAAEDLLHKPGDPEAIERIRATWQSRYQPRKEKSNAFKFWSMREFLELDLFREYHIPGILAAGPTPCIISGSFKTLKTSIGMDLLISLASATRFLGKYDVPTPVAVGAMSGESGAHNLQDIARRVMRSKGLLSNSIPDGQMILSSAIPRLSNVDHMEEIERVIVDNGLKVMLIDPMYMALMGLQSDQSASVFAMGERLAILGDISQRTGAVIIAVHHNSRGRTRANPFEPAELDDISHAGFAEWAAQWMLLSRRSRFDPDGNGEHELWITAGGRDGHSTLIGVDVVEGRKEDPGGRRWEVAVVEAKEARKEKAEEARAKREAGRIESDKKRYTTDRKRVMDYIQAMPESGDTMSCIRNGSGVDSKRLPRILSDLLTEGVIVHTDSVMKNRCKYEGYRRSNSPDSRSDRTDDQIGLSYPSG